MVKDAEEALMECLLAVKLKYLQQTSPIATYTVLELNMGLHSKKTASTCLNTFKRQFNSPV
jgi:hypothetical protein